MLIYGSEIMNNNLEKVKAVVIDTKDVLPAKQPFRNSKLVKVSYWIDGKHYNSENAISKGYYTKRGDIIDVWCNTNKCNRVYRCKLLALISSLI